MSGYQVPRSTRTRTCRGKKRYRTLSAAEEHRDRLIREEGAQAHELDVYQCLRCGGDYHVGHAGTPGRAR